MLPLGPENQGADPRPRSIQTAAPALFMSALTPAQRPAFRRILLAHDGGPASARALAWGAHWASLDDADVTVACVAPPPEMPPDGMSAYGWWPQMLEQYGETVRALHDAAESAVDILRAKGIRAKAVVPRGSAPRELSRVAVEMSADLAIVGTHDRHGLARWLIGSTSEALLGRLDASLLVARTSPPAARLLVAVDGSRASKRATAVALRYAASSASEVTVQHVVPDEGEHDDISAPGDLQRAVERLHLPAHPPLRYAIDAGKPAERILARASAEPADLVVMGARGLGSLGAKLLGSVSHRVAEHAPASVLVVRDAHA